MTPTTFTVGTSTTHGFRLVLALVTAALIGFVVEVSRPVDTHAAYQPAAPAAPAASMPIAMK